ncbi:hypothetical protein [Thalassobacillus sp. C254]|uniref:hypothetical protein n=1 Tax=Thalassobacillus sp. C254 TaxID=1225341 RepID=UPI0006D05DE0|nr:hypothetical protein [Thalassobacillus sp. C254]
MSGPKYSQLQLERARQRRLEQERQRRLEEERRKLELQRHIQALHTQFQQVKEKVAHYGKDILTSASQYNLQDSYSVQLLEDKKQHLQEQLAGFTKTYNENQISSMESYRKDLKFLLEEVSKEFQKDRLEKIKNVEKEITSAQSHEKQEAFLQESENLSVNEKKNYAIPEVKRKEKPQEYEVDLEEVVDQVKEELAPYLETSQLPFHSEVYSLYQSILSIYKNESFDSGYKKSQIDMRMSTFFTMQPKYDERMSRFQKQVQEYDDVYLHYQSLCKVLEKEESSAYSFDGVWDKDALQQEVIMLERELADKQQAQYISESVEEVMGSLGYDIVANDYMVRTKQTVHHNIYELGINTGVNVFVSDQGSVLFEVSGVSEQEKDLTSNERVEVKEAWRIFVPTMRKSKKG